MLIGKYVKLRALDYEDMERLTVWRNDPEVYSWFYEYEPQSFSAQTSWFEQYNDRQDELLLMIATLDDRPLGTIGLTEIDLRNGKAYLGRFYIGDPENRIGRYGAEAEYLLLKYAFDHLRLNKVYCEVFAFNKSVVKLHEHFGFKIDGTLRQHIFHEGKYADVVVLSILKWEYRQMLGHMKDWLDD